MGWDAYLRYNFKHNSIVTITFNKIVSSCSEHLHAVLHVGVLRIRKRTTSYRWHYYILVSPFTSNKISPKQQTGHYRTSFNGKDV